MTENERNQFYKVVSNLNRDRVISLEQFDTDCVFKANGIKMSIPLNEPISNALRDLTNQLNYSRKISK